MLNMVEIVIIAASSFVALMIILYVANTVRRYMKRTFIAESTNSILMLGRLLVSVSVDIGTDVFCFVVNLRSCTSISILLKISMGTG